MLFRSQWALPFAFLGEGKGPLSLCIAGPRESEAPGIYAKTLDFLRELLCASFR